MRTLLKLVRDLLRDVAYGINAGHAIRHGVPVPVRTRDCAPGPDGPRGARVRHGEAETGEALDRGRPRVGDRVPRLRERRAGADG
jgi:hypothetical protein